MLKKRRMKTAQMYYSKTSASNTYYGQVASESKGSQSEKAVREKARERQIDRQHASTSETSEED